MVIQPMSEKKEKKKGKEAQELVEILEAVQETIPSLISRLVQSIYSPEVAEDIAKSVGTLYQNLKKQGLPEEMVLEMTRSYMKILDIRELVSEGFSRSAKGKLDVEVDRAIRKKVDEKDSE